MLNQFGLQLGSHIPPAVDPLSMPDSRLGFCRCVMTLPVLLCWMLLAPSVHGAEDSPESLRAAIAETAQSIERLRDQRDALVSQLDTAPPPMQADLESSLRTVQQRLDNASGRFEELATGGVDMAVFEQVSVEFDWRTDVLETLRPMFDNLKRLTEKPRRITDLRNQIDQNAAQLDAAEGALEQLERVREELGTSDDAVLALLEPLESEWREQLDTLGQERELAQVRLERLLGENAHWRETLAEGLTSFANGRGLTLALAVLVMLLTWWALRGVARLVHGTRLDPTRRKARPAWRLVGFGAQSALFVAPAVLALVVFYVRGDVLLLALAAVIAFLALLALRDLLPQYVAEARVLLNLGSAREGERVIYRGLPWDIVSLNVHCTLRNPKLHGVLRLPLGELVGMVSRPGIEGETWYPSQSGDILLTPDGDLVEVGQQTTEQVELRTLAGDVRYLSAEQVFGWGARNLSAGGGFGVAQTFGLDYALQGDALDTVPVALKAGVESAIKTAGVQDHVQSVMVELQTAGASSLDFLVYIHAHPSAARRYFQLQRIAQQACVSVCNAKGWSIPFPQLTLHRAD